MNDPRLQQRLAWMREGARLFMERADALGDEATTGPSMLAGWSRAHLLSHLARNADALVNLLTWARTGVETPMYPNAATRNADIERGAKRPGPEIMEDLREAEARLNAALDGMPEAAWNATLRSAQGRSIPASEVPWMRTREVWIHLLDLGMGDDFDVLPADLLDALLADGSMFVGRRPQCPPVVLRPDDRVETYRLGPKEAQPEEVRGHAAELCAWLLGRDTPMARAVAARTPAVLPPWL
jgi:maleylpyruvate isomerase